MSVVTMPSGWKQIQREVSRASAIIRIRASGDLAISAQFVSLAKIAEHTRTNIFLSEDGYKIGLLFHSDETRENSFQLGKDGGNKQRKTNNRIIQNCSLRKQSEIFAKTLKLPNRHREFTPRQDINGLWVIELRPAFEVVYRMPGEVPRDATGIYRYSMDQEIVYIGRGRLTERFGSADRAEWQFNKIEYSILNDEASEIKWEAYWIDCFREMHSRLPIYNRISGHMARTG